MKKVALLIPCYNEALTIADVIKESRQFCPDLEIYVYDNNSTDDTAKIAESLGVIVRKEPKQGKGNVIRTMFKDVEADCYVMVDGDNTYGLETLPQMIAGVLEEGCDMVIGDRLSGAYYQENKRPFHNLGNKLVRDQLHFFFRAKINDIMTGYRAFSRAFVKSFPVTSNGFEIETEMSIHAANYHLKTKEITITYRDRPEGSFSKLNTYKDGFKVLKTIKKKFIKYQPMKFFGVISLLSLLFIFCLLV